MASFVNTFESNLNVFCENSNINRESLDLDLAKKKSLHSSLQKDADEWRSKSNDKAICFPSYMGNKDTVNIWREKYQDFSSVESISDYIDLHDDPHLKLLMSDYYRFLSSIDVDPEDGTYVSSTPIQSLVCLGTGNGQFLASLINQYKPFNLVVIVTRWEDFISSFWCVDWNEINDFFAKPFRNIRVVRIEPDVTELLSNAAINGILAMEGTYIYSPSSTENDLLSLKSSLVGREVHNLLLYQGYTVDEYNMIYNSARFFKKNPKIYYKPDSQLSKNVAVIGSGPSLDYSLDLLKELSETHVIVCGGSNYRVLLSHGIVPDFLTLVERADGVYDTYKEIYDEFGSTTTKLVISSTCFDKMADIFPDTCIFYRPALTPAVLFAESNNEIITHEGPQAVCAALSFAINMKPDNIVFVGVDLGAADTTKPRSAKAIGYSPREFEDTADGNFVDTIYTDKMLLDCRDVMGACINFARINHFQGMIYNASNGVRINGAKPIKLSDYTSMFNIDDDSKQIETINTWWSSLSTGNTERMSAIMELRKPRSGTLTLIDDLREILKDSSLAWMPTLVQKIEYRLNIVDVPPRLQVPRRIIKSSILKALNTTTQYLIRMNKSEELKDKQQSFIDFSKARILQLLDQFEREVYILCDAVDELMEVKS